MAGTFPDLKVHPASRLSFPWSEYQTEPVLGSSTHTFGSDGVTVGMKMLILWEDLSRACQELLGYSWRDDRNLTSRGTPFLRRKLPWQHPIWNQLYIKRISEVRGVRHQGFDVGPDEPIGSGAGEMPNIGPAATYKLAELTLHFWRPPYYVRSDAAILEPGTNNNPREWLRYVSKQWDMSLNMLSRENSTFQWIPGIKSRTAGPLFTGSVGQTVTHFRVSRTWYEIPEQALFNTISGGIPDGLPAIVYTLSSVENPLSLYYAALGTTQTNFTTTTTIGTSSTTITSTRTTRLSTTPSGGDLAAARGYIYPGNSPMGGCINSPVGGGRAVDGAGTWIDLTIASRLFGCRTGTLRFDGVTFTPKPLQLPAILMQIPSLAAVEPLSQQQYDVTFHFDLFEPPPGSNYGSPLVGHNLFPYSGNGLWYPIISQRDANDDTIGPNLPPFHYADFSDLFYIL